MSKKMNAKELDAVLGTSLAKSGRPPEVQKYTTLRDLTNARVPQPKLPVRPPAQKDDPTTMQSNRGRVLIFIPTGEKVTVVRDVVGQNYSGEWVSEVISREGKKFLAARKQLREKT